MPIIRFYAGISDADAGGPPHLIDYRDRGTSPEASFVNRRADNFARCTNESTTTASSGEWIEWPTGPRESRTGMPVEAILLASEAPPEGVGVKFNPSCWPQVCRAVNTRSLAGDMTQGGEEKWPWSSAVMPSCWFAAATSSASRDSTASRWAGVVARQLKRRMARSGTTLTGPPPS